MEIKKSTIVRTILLAVAIINVMLNHLGVKTLPVDEATATTIADAFLSIMSGICWWYNNSFSEYAIEADEYMVSIKRNITTEYDEAESEVEGSDSDE